MSTSTRIDRLTDEILRSLADLVQSRPHMSPRAKWDTREMRAYFEGYSWGATYALRVVVEAIRRVEDQERWKRQSDPKKRSA